MNPENRPNTGVILGKNIGVEWTGQRIRNTVGHLSPWSEIGVEAGGLQITQGKSEIVLFTVGNTAGSAPLSPDEGIASQDLEGIGQPLKSEAEYMWIQFAETFPALANKGFIQPNSWDTNTDAKEIQKLMEENRMDPNNWSLSTIGFHLDRALRLFKRQGLVPSNAFATEELYGELRAKMIQSSHLYKAEEKKERIARAVQFFPIAGRFATEAISKRTNQTRLK